MSSSASSPPYNRAEARKMARQAAEDGAIVYAEPHAKDRMRQRNISTLDVENILRAGFVRDEPELSDKGTWRYRVCSNRFAIIIEFWPGGRVFVVTCIRI